MHSSCDPHAQGCLCVCCVGAVASDDCGDNVFLLCLRLCPMCMCARMIFTSKEVWCLWSTAGSASMTETGVAERTGPVSRCLENHCCVVEVKRNSLGIQCRGKTFSQIYCSVGVVEFSINSCCACVVCAHTRTCAHVVFHANSVMWVHV